MSEQMLHDAIARAELAEAKLEELIERIAIMEESGVPADARMNFNLVDQYKSMNRQLRAANAELKLQCETHSMIMQRIADMLSNGKPGWMVLQAVFGQGPGKP